MRHAKKKITPPLTLVMAPAPVSRGADYFWTFSKGKLKL